MNSECSDRELHSLIRCIWPSQACDGITGVGNTVLDSCTKRECPLQRGGRFSTFFRFYQRQWQVLSSGSNSSTFGSDHHQILMQFVELIKRNSEMTKVELIQASGQTGLSVDKQRQLFDFAMRILTMINCSSKDLTLGLVEFGTAQHGWLDNMTAKDVLEKSFPDLTYSHVPKYKRDESEEVIESKVNAQQLRRRAKVQFKATDDIRNHLRFDRELRVVEIFHHATFLKEHLRLTKGCTSPDDIVAQLRIGALPRQLALETLDSVQKILFRHSDAKSRAILRSLVAREGFDRGALHFESSSIRSSNEQDVMYIHFGGRLAELYEEMEHPSPVGPLQQWLERKSGSRYVMLATLIGVVFAVILGILSLAVSTYQTYITYQAWQHPVSG